MDFGDSINWKWKIYLTWLYVFQLVTGRPWRRWGRGSRKFDAGRNEKSSERQLAFAFVRFEQEIGCHTEPPHSSYAPSKLLRADEDCVNLETFSYVWKCFSVFFHLLPCASLPVFNSEEWSEQRKVARVSLRGKRWGNCILGLELRDTPQARWNICALRWLWSIYFLFLVVLDLPSSPLHRTACNWLFLFLWRLHGKSFFWRKGEKICRVPSDRLTERQQHSKEGGKKLEQNFSASGSMSVGEGAK